MPVTYLDKRTGRRFRFDDGTTPEQAKLRMREYYERERLELEQQAAQEREDYVDYLREHRTGFGSGVRRGMDMIPIMARRGLAAVADQFGATGKRDELLASAQERAREMEQTNPSLYESFGEAPFGYFMERLGEQVPNLATVAAGGGAGALLGRAALGASGMAGGALAGATLPSYGLAVGENYGDYVERYGVDQASSGAALAAGVPQAALDVAGLRALGLAFKPRRLADATNQQLADISERSLTSAMARGAGAGALRGGVTESVTEGTQEAIKRGAGSLSAYGDLREFESPETWADIGESALVGAMIGKPIGGIGGAYTGAKERGEATRRLQQRDPGRPVAGEFTPYDPALPRGGALPQLGYDPSLYSRQMYAEREAANQGPQIPEGALVSPYDPTPNAPGGLAAFGYSPDVTPFGAAFEGDTVYDPYGVGPLGPYMAEIERANAQQPNEFDALMSRARVDRAAIEAEQAQAARDAAWQESRPTPIQRFDPIVGNDLFAYQEAEGGLPKPKPPKRPKRMIEDPYVPMAERDPLAQRSTDEEQVPMPGVAPALFDDAQRGKRADIVAPFEAAGLKPLEPAQARRASPYERAASDLYTRFMQDRREFDPTDVQARRELFSMLGDLARFARNPISLSKPQQREALNALMAGMAERDGSRLATRTVPASETTAPVVAQESALPTGAPLPELPQRKKQESVAAPVEVTPELMTRAKEAWDANATPETGSWDQMQDPQMQRVLVGKNKTEMLEPIVPGKDQEFATTLRDDARANFARWLAERPNATPEQIRAEVQRTAKALREPLDLTKSVTEKADQQKAESAAAKATPKKEGDDQGKAAKAPKRAPTKTQRLVSEATRKAKERIMANNTPKAKAARRKDEVATLDPELMDDAFADADLEREINAAFGARLFSRSPRIIPDAAKGKEESNPRLVAYLDEAGKRGRPLPQVLAALIMTSKSKRNRLLANRILQLLGPLADDVGVFASGPSPQVRNPDGSVSDSFALGDYAGIEGVSTPSKSAGIIRIFDEAIGASRLEETILHEAMHAASVAAYQRNPKFRAEVRALMTRARRLMPDWKGSNAFDNGMEFISAVYTAPDFRAALRAAQDGPKSLFARFMEALHRLFGAKPDIVAAMDAILERGWEPISLTTEQMQLKSELRSTSGTVFQNDVEWRRHIEKEANSLGTRVKAALESAVGTAGKKLVYGSMDLRSLTKLLDEVSERVRGKGNKPGEKLVDALFKQDSADRSVRASFDANAIEPLRKLRNKSPEAFKQVEDMLFKASYMRYDPSAPEGGNKRKLTDEASTAEQRALQSEFDALAKSNPDAAAAFRAVAQSTRQSFKELTDSILAYNERLLSNMREGLDQMPSDERASANTRYANAKAGFERLKTVIEDLGSVTPYVPFMRHGDFLISYVGPDGVNGVVAYETQTQRDAVYEQMRKTGTKAEKFNRYQDPEKFLDTLDVAGKAAARAIKDVRDAVLTDVGDPNVENIFKDIESRVVDLLGATTPAARLLENVRQRMNVPGMHTDIMRGLSSYALTAGKALASLKHGAEVSRAYSEVNKLAKASAVDKPEGAVPSDDKKLYMSPEDLQAVKGIVDELNTRRDFIMNPVHSPIANNMAKAGFFYFMGANPSSAALQLFQIGMVQFPVLSGRYGTSKAFSALYDATTRLFSGDKPLRKFLESEAYELARYDATALENGKAKPGADARTKKYADLRNSSDRQDQYKAMIVDLLRAGVVSDSMTQDLVVFKAGDDPDSMRNRVERVAGFMMRWTENTNRLASAMAAFDLARSHAKRDWDTAIREAGRMVYEGHGDYSAINTPRWFQSNVGKVLLLFKKFGFHMYTQMAMFARDAISKSKTPEERAEAAKKLSVMMLTTIPVTGLAGMPMYGLATTLYYLWQSAFGEDDETRDLTIALRQVMDEMGVNPTVREAFLKGGATMAGIGLSSRLGYADMFFRDPEENLDQQKVLEWAATTIGGPLAGAVNMIGRGVEQVADGDVAAGLTSMAPSALRNAIKAVMMGVEGEVKTRRGDPIAETDALDAFMQALGFRPAQLDLQMEVNLAAKAIDQRLQSGRADLLRKYRVAWAAGDTDAMSALRERIVEWNEQARSIGAPKLAITPDALKRSVRSMEANNALLRHGMVYGRQTIQVTESLRSLAE